LQCFYTAFLNEEIAISNNRVPVTGNTRHFNHIQNLQIENLLFLNPAAIKRAGFPNEQSDDLYPDSMPDQISNFIGPVP
jgi:hypothetical protein